MAINLYLRVSTLDQSFEQQMQDIKAYFSANRLNMDDISNIVEEHVSGGKSYEDRKFQQLLQKCKPGDYIYAASTDRLGRNFMDMMHLMDDAKQRGVIIVACKQNLSLADDNSMAKIVLAVTAIIDEDERKRIRHRVKNGVTVAMEELQRKGERITRRGTVQTHWGNKKGCDLTVARTASAKSRADLVIAWRERSKAVRFALRKSAEGWSVTQITNELSNLYAENPEIYSTPTGCKPSKGHVSRWIKEANPLLA